MDHAAALQRRHEAATPLETRKEKGQVFTPSGIARFMASLLTRFPDPFRLLDPGAGAGLLSSAVCERLCALGSPRRIDIHLYETDPTLLPLLDANLRHCRAALLASGQELRFTIHQDDFILGTRGRPDQRMLFDDGGEEEDFDAVIMNPPYFKIGAESPQAMAMGEAFRGNTNIYMLFMARAAERLRPGGEMVAITPRSFCNGLYFRNFRRWFFARMGLRHVHLFECRRSTFDDVLQESLITLTDRLGIAPTAATTTITTSPGREIPATPEPLSLPTRKVLDDSAGDMVVRIPSSAEELGILDAVEAWPDRFADLGLAISTGPVVLFRAREYLLPEPDGVEAAPLFEPHNVKRFETIWPVERRGKPTAFRVCRDSLKHLVPARNYVLLRRFSAKEERRRLTASWFLHGPGSGPYLALENHLNYVYHSERELTADEVRGLTALFNSALLDQSFRLMSGNTQVNATEIRTMRFPRLDRVAAIGAAHQRFPRLSPGRGRARRPGRAGDQRPPRSLLDGNRIVSKLDEAKEILAALGLPRAEQNDRSALTLLALANLGPESDWAAAERPLLRTVDLMEFMRQKYDRDYRANMRETIRRQTIHQFEQARIVDRNPDEPGRPTNSGKNAYMLTEEATEILKAYGTTRFGEAVASFIGQFGELKAAYERVRATHRIPLRLPDGSTVSLSAGEHNALQAAVIEEFGPRFAPGATVLYVGDTAKKHVIYERDELARIGVPINEHDKLPDVILFDQGKSWLFLIEAVTSHGPVSPKRHWEIEAFLRGCAAERIYVTAFLTIGVFRKYAADIAWETEVWIAATPDHMIHFNGPKFLGPHRPESSGQKARRTKRREKT